MNYSFKHKHYWVEVEFTPKIDRGYGTDADGNRGSTMIVIDDLKIEIIDTDTYDDVTADIKAREPNLFEQIEGEAFKGALDRAEGE